ncbi:MAG: hypothetical protein AAB787_01440 [Patescibacteria group bacterium]
MDPYLKLLKFLHHLLFWIAFVVMAAFVYQTIKVWPDKPVFDPKFFWVVIDLITGAFFVFMLTKAWPMRPHLRFHYGKIKRPKTPDDIEIFEKWKSIRQRIWNGDQDEVKQAILEADKIVNHALENHGFDGSTTEDKIFQILSDDLWRPREAAKKANKFHNKISENPDIEVDRSDAKKAIHNYEILLEELDVIDRRDF